MNANPVKIVYCEEYGIPYAKIYYNMTLDEFEDAYGRFWLSLSLFLKNTEGIHFNLAARDIDKFIAQASDDNLDWNNVEIVNDISGYYCLHSQLDEIILSCDFKHAYEELLEELEVFDAMGENVDVCWVNLEDGYPDERIARVLFSVFNSGNSVSDIEVGNISVDEYSVMLKFDRRTYICEAIREYFINKAEEGATDE